MLESMNPADQSLDTESEAPPIQRTSDGRYIVVNGRRWRATDPNIPESLRKELVTELMDARRAVKAAKTNPEALAMARSRVQNAKVALGERGEKWWDSHSVDGRSQRATAAILALLAKRGPDSSICPSDAARVVASPDWRPAMPLVRSVAAELSRQGQVRITQGEVTIEDPANATGPLRYRQPEP